MPPFQLLFSRALVISLHFLSYSFNFLLLWLIYKRRILKTKSYILNMIVAEILINLSQNLVIEANWRRDEKRIESFGFFGMVYFSATQFRYLLTLLMSLNRFFVSIWPSSSCYFDQEMVYRYSNCLWATITFSNLFYYLNTCQYFYNSQIFEWSMKCIIWNVPNYISKFYYILILTCIFNIAAVLYSKIRRLISRKIIQTSVIPRLSDTAAENRRRKENKLMFHSIVIMVVMMVDVFYRSLHLYVINAPIFGTLATYFCILVNFLIYFVFNKYIRKNMINLILRRPKYVADTKIGANNLK